MLCAISGVAPQAPVVSSKSGNLFEKHLIELYIAEHGRDPVTNEELTIEDLIELKSARTVAPRPPTLTSIPSLLSTLQKEWDALSVETFKIKQELVQTRQQLATALYQHDAAVRVIATLQRDRDMARKALSHVSVNGDASSSGTAMQVDAPKLSDTLIAKITSAREELSSARKQRKVPSDWATGDTIKAFKPLERSKALYPGAMSLCANSSGDLVLTGGDNGVAGIYSVSKNRIVQELQVGSGAVTDAIWAGSRAVVSTSSGVVKVFEDGSEIAAFSGHVGEVTSLAVHPSTDLVASVGIDKSYILYDLTSLTQATQVYSDSELTRACFHPDGGLLAAGALDGRIKVYTVATGNQEANLDAGGIVQALSFSENGYWLAVVVKGSTSASILDLRKDTVIKVLDTGEEIEHAVWDHSGQFLVLAGPSGLAVQQYVKATKEWLEPLRTAIPSVAVKWGSRAQKLIILNGEGEITVLGST